MKRPPPVGTPFTCPLLDRLATYLHHIPEPDQHAARICVELLRLAHHDLRSAAEQRVPKEHAAIQSRIDELFTRLEPA